MAEIERIRSYSEIITIDNFLDRFNYLKLGGSVGAETFGFDRYINQRFYTSREWMRVRDFIITRDFGCDLGVYGYEIYDKVYVHHMNPINANDIKMNTDILLNPEYLITTSFNTHNAIHYGDINLLDICYNERYPNDTCPWK